MNFKEREEIFDALIQECRGIMNGKGESYAGTHDGDANANFKRIAERLDMSYYEVWAVYFNKHVESINNAIIENPLAPKDNSEGLRSRIHDIINYAVILEALLIDDGLSPESDNYFKNIKGIYD